mgnify:CR=1 FL=1
MNLNIALELLAVLTVHGQRGAIRFEPADVRIQSLFDLRDVLRKRSDFLLQRGDSNIDTLKLDNQMNIWIH